MCIYFLFCFFSFIFFPFPPAPPLFFLFVFGLFSFIGSFLFLLFHFFYISISDRGWLALGVYWVSFWYIKERLKAAQENCPLSLKRQKEAQYQRNGRG